MNAEQAVAESLVSAIHALLDGPPERIDLAGAKLAVDKLIDPNLDVDHVRAEIDGMVAIIGKMLGTLPAQEAATSLAKLQALRSFLYRSGHWNDGRPFQYDLDDPLGQKPEHRLLANYLAARKGNCISMPMLFAILAE